MGAVRSTTRTQVVKNTTKRRNVGAIIDQNMLGVAAGMAATSAVQGMLEPLKARVPQQFQKFIDPAMAVVGYTVSQKAKNPIIRGIGLGVMAEGVKGTVQVIMGVMKPATTAPAMPAAPGQPQMPAGNMGATYYLPLPNMSGIGNIPTMMAGSENQLAPLPNMGGAYEQGDYLPLGWDSGNR